MAHSASSQQLPAGQATNQVGDQHQLPKQSWHQQPPSCLDTRAETAAGSTV